MKVIIRKVIHWTIFLYFIFLVAANSCQIPTSIISSVLSLHKKSALSIEYCPSQYNDSTKICNARGRYMERKLWNYYTGALCYSYTNDYRLSFRYKIINGQFSCENTTITIPVTVIDSTYFWYDYKNDTSLEYIKKSFKTDEFFKMWVNCCQEAVDCCDNYMNDTNIYSYDQYPCPAVWDGWSCFAPAEANSINKMPCSSQAYSTNSDVCVLNSEKECFANGTWNQQTNYQVCAIAPVLRNRHTFHVIVLSVGLVLMAPAAILLLSFVKFRKSMRLTLHRNLIIVMIIRSVLTIMSKEIIILDALKATGSNKIMVGNGIPCRILAFFESAAKNGIYASMLVDGFYLHKLIVRAFASDPQMKYLYGIVAVISFLPSLIWASLRGIKNDSDCWMVDHDGDQWVVDGFRMAILGINSVLLLDIIRVVVLKLKHGSTTQQTKATFRAMLFLIPLFGIHIIVFADRSIVTSDTCYAEDVYYYASYFMEALQGVMVALLFCYMSGEVHTELKNAYRKFSLYLEQKYGFTSRRQIFSRRRTTAATYVGQDGLSNAKSSLNSLNNQFLNNSVGESPEGVTSFWNNRVSKYIDDVSDSHI